MWRMALVGVVVGLIYVLVPLGSGQSGPPARSIETFGKPWTFQQFLSALADAGVEMALDAPIIVDELPIVPGVPERGGLPGPVLVAEGRHEPGGFSGYVLIYRSIEQRGVTWPDEGSAPLVDGRPLIAEGVGFIVDNAVVFRAAPFGGSYGPSFAALEAVFRKLKD